MSRLGFLALLASFASGTWVGLGRPTAAEVRALAEDYAARLAMPKLPHLPSAHPPPMESATPGVDPSQLPDPAFPRLNPTASAKRAWLLAEGPYHAPEDGRRLVTFTFDDGPFPETTPSFLRILAKHHVHATFFWIGHYLDGNKPRDERTRQVARQVVAEGHLIGNHTYDHTRLVNLPKTEILQQIDDSAAAIERTTGKRPAVFRPPYGQLDLWTSERLRDRGTELVLWSIEANDMKADDGQAIADSLREQLEYAGGGIVLLHDIRFGSADALERLLTWIDHHKYNPETPDVVGYEVVDLGQYLRATEASPQPYADRAELETARSHGWVRDHPQKQAPPLVKVALVRSADSG